MCDEHTQFHYCRRCGTFITSQSLPLSCPVVLRSGRELGACGDVYRTGMDLHQNLCPRCEEHIKRQQARRLQRQQGQQ